MAAWALTIRPPPPSPCTARKAISSGKVLADAAQGRADQEDHQADLEDDAATELVTQLSVERRDHRLSEQVGGRHPRDVVKPTQVAGDGRQRGRHDRGVQRRHQHDEHQPGEHQGELAAVELLGPVNDSQSATSQPYVRPAG